jgi:hypothetical protein
MRNKGIEQDDDWRNSHPSLDTFSVFIGSLSMGLSAFRVQMKRIALVILLLSPTAVTGATAAIHCRDAAGHEQGAHWSWRDIEGRRCWFIREGTTMPPKSEFTWDKGIPAKQDSSAVPEQKKREPTITVVKTTADEMSEVRANWLDDAPIDLMRNQDLSGPAGVGGNWVVPPYAANADEETSFTARFTREGLGQSGPK